MTLLWYCDPEYLLDMLRALPGCRAYGIPNKPTTPIYFCAENGDGILLPVRPPREEQEAA